MPSPAAAAAAVAGAAGVGAVGDPCTVVVVADPHSPTAEPRSRGGYYMSKLRCILTFWFLTKLMELVHQLM